MSLCAYVCFCGNYGMALKASDWIIELGRLSIGAQHRLELPGGHGRQFDVLDDSLDGAKNEKMVKFVV